MDNESNKSTLSKIYSPVITLKKLVEEQISNMINSESSLEDRLRCHNYALGALDYAKEIQVVNDEQYNELRTQIDSVANSIMK